MSQRRIVTPLAEEEKRQWERLIEKTLLSHMTSYKITSFEDSGSSSIKYSFHLKISVAIIFVPIIFC